MIIYPLLALVGSPKGHEGPPATGTVPGIVRVSCILPHVVKHTNVPHTNSSPMAKELTAPNTPNVLSPGMSTAPSNITRNE